MVLYQNHVKLENIRNEKGRKVREKKNERKRINGREKKNDV